MVEVEIISMLMPAEDQGFEHLGGDAKMGLHAGADQGNLGDFGIDVDRLGIDLTSNLLGDAFGVDQVGPGNGEADVGAAVV